MSVGRQPNGKWRARVKSGGAVVADRTFERKGDAERWEAEQKRSLALGDWVDPRAGRVTLGDHLERWLKTRDGTVAPQTFKADISRLRTHIPTNLRRRPIGSIRSSDISALLGEVMRRGASRASVLRLKAVLAVAFAAAVDDRLIARSPVQGVKVPPGTGSAPDEAVNPFSYSELKQLHAALKKEHPEQADIALVLGLTGLRWGEICALRVRDVQLVPRPSFRVSRSASDGAEVRTTKSGRARSVPLSGEVLEIVQPRLEGDPDSYLFPSPTGARLHGTNWRRAVNWTKHRQGRRVHDLRHTAATMWLSAGIDPKTVQAWLGHASATLTLDLYGHYLPGDADVAALSRLEAFTRGHAGDMRGKAESATLDR